jgi:hypothetical protein
MDSWLTLTEMAAALGLKDAAGLRWLCRVGGMPRAVLKGKAWLVPPETVAWYRRERTGKCGRPPEERTEMTGSPDRCPS